MTWMRWAPATERALYGPDGGFYRRPEGPAGHFRTSVHASPLFARAVARLLLEVDAALGRPEELAFVDVGAGRGELVAGVLAELPEAVGGRLRVYAVELAERPPLPPAAPSTGLWTEERRAGVVWTDEVPRGVTGLLFANEWLDNVPLDTGEVGEDGRLRYLEVDTGTGEERLGAPVDAADAAWAARWWPAEHPGDFAEFGTPRDAAWAHAVAGLDRGLAVAADYGHTAARRPPFPTRTGFRDGREVAPVPDGSCDVTAHVALDAVAVPGLHSLWTTQREALRALGVSGARPALALASTDPAAYLRALGGAGEGAELTDPAGLGAFGWLAQTVRMPVPPSLEALPGWQTLIP
ncbi:SAM-dependent methyltransferase [Kitasatospora sp. NPDC057500]|uniref:SAM-dependent methyltransferase n=1 Tax=Kitasatospora sp. NPDC057500 TaxID=3346151 RepID=UPI0036C464EF